jgi:hypothetical protein
MNQITARIATLTAASALALSTLFTTGCAGRTHVAYVPEAGEASAPPSDDVEVLLDQAPERPFVVTGQLFAQSFSNPQSIDLMRDRAKAAGLDGIYWIDCTSTCSGHCSAKGFVYEDRAMAKGLTTGRQVASER